MSFLYRNGLLIGRKQPYLDWANSVDQDGPGLSVDLSSARRSLYLVPEANGEPDVEALVDEFWADIFERELEMWMIADDCWPAPRTRDMFDAWFDVELNDSVFDLTPEEPLTQAEVDEADLAEMMQRCASCGIELAENDGRLTGFKLANRTLYKPFEGRVLPLAIDDSDNAEIVLTIVTSRDSAAAKEGHDVVVRVCSSRCEKVMRSVVPKALRRLSRRVRSVEGGE
jgi:hypothetical protein